MRILVHEVLLALALFGGLMGLIEFGYWLGSRRPRTERKEGQIGVVLGAMLGLLGLLLGFSYSGTTQRFADRENGVVREANAIRTAHFRTDLIRDPGPQMAIRADIGIYAVERLRLFETLDERASDQVQERLRTLHRGIWNAAVATTEADPA